VTGIYAMKGPFWALSSEWLAADATAAGLAQINAVSNLAGSGAVYLIGLIKNATGSYPLALLPLVALAAMAALVALALGRARQPAVRPAQ
jgi:MFS transporter, ACS family, tartrate transporter